MNSSVASVVRGEFLFRDLLLVDVGGELKRHPRASEGEIKRYLEDKESKDQVAHWYEAQLVHYGLQRSKDKNTAKVRLQQALNQKKLKAAPPHLVDMEASMKREYAAAVRKAKTPSKPLPAAGKGTKRARDEEELPVARSKKTKVSVQIGDVNIDIEHSTSSKKPVSRAKATPTSRRPKQDMKNAASARAPPTTPTPYKMANSGATLNYDSLQDVPSSSNTSLPTATPRVRPKQTARKSVIGFGGPPSSQQSTIKPDPYDQASHFPSSPAPTTSTSIKPEPTHHATSSPPQINITGVYNILTPHPHLSTLSSKASRLFLAVDNSTNKIWGSFELGWYGGTIKIDQIATNRAVCFGWRARDHEKPGNMRFGKECVGEMEFFGDQEVRGVFHNLLPEAVHFEGKRRAGPLWSGKSVYAYEKEWEGFPKEAYGR
ncbi:hypothetical protein CLAFUW4_02385 [Fulvia fulva]|nr:hypothetical protein CLAFUR4_02380 [Fulvia fulva]KAK4632617.1 hypothetical protein CLAFUR0_02384 [Fulvia fulva]WPV11695.1 hypothetical protein CLAFUW4_02385 [Fulvia fulva]WPV26697.1 hypothetical protein CLAFUW7_02385 [Fulvia fulva]